MEKLTCFLQNQGYFQALLAMAIFKAKIEYVVKM